MDGISRECRVKLVWTLGSIVALGLVMLLSWPLFDGQQAQAPVSAPSALETKSWSKDYPSVAEGGIFRPDPRRFWALQAGCRGKLAGQKVTINKMGLRGPEITRKKPGEFRILMLGDAAVFGQGVCDTDTIAAFLQEHLNRTVPGYTSSRSSSSSSSSDSEGFRPQYLGKSHITQYTVLNGGVPGYSTYQGVALASELAQQPLLGVDMVLLAYLAEDRTLAPVVDRMRAKAEAANTASPVCRVPPVETGSNTVAMISSFSPAPALAVVLPSVKPNAADDKFVACLAVSSMSIQGAEFVDLNKSWADRVGVSGLPHYFLDETHLNAAGCEAVAQDLLPKVMALVPEL